MPNINRALRESDTAILPILAGVWGVNVDKLMDSGEIIDALSKAMLNSDRAERVWGLLDEKQRGALFMLIGAGAKMPTPKFERLFGEIRRMGAAQIERERPDKNPSSLAEALYYYGLIAQGYENTGKGSSAIVYVPDDLLKVLPTHKTQYEHLDDEDAPDEEAESIAIESMPNATSVRAADTSAVDDLTTLLAYIQLQTPALDLDQRMQQLSDYRLVQEDRDALAPLLLTPGEERLTFLLGLGLAAGLVEARGGHAHTQRAEARRWLEAPRADQIRRLAEAWRDSRVYRDLWHVPGLYPEPGGALDSYDPAVVRQAVAGFLADLVPGQAWWSMDAFIGAVKETDPDFQRPGGDYDSWYIRNEEGDYLEGFESWDAVEGALLEYTLLGPMHWLGLVDVGDDAARLTVFGRAFLNLASWPNPPEAPEKITLREDGTLLVSRKVPRIDRFQIARFTTWFSAGDPYTYKLDPRGIARAGAQGISVGHITAFLTKATGDQPLPPKLAQLLETWRAGPTTTVSMERLLILRTTSPEVLDKIWESPALRRYLGARLGEMAVIVRADQWEALRDALGEQGIQVDTPI